MRKLQRFVLNDARMLSREEMSSIEGRYNFSGMDNCTTSSEGAHCLTASWYDTMGHYGIIIGKCAIKIEKKGTVENHVPYCY